MFDGEGMNDGVAGEISGDADLTDGALALKAAPNTSATAVTREQRRSRRKREIRARTISVKRMTKRELEIGRMLYPETDYTGRRPAAECADGRAPVPLRVVPAPPLPRRVGPHRRDQAELPRPRGLGHERDAARSTSPTAAARRWRTWERS